MDSEEFDDLIARLTSGSSRRAPVRGVLAGSLAAAGVPMLAEAKNGTGKRKHGKGRPKRSLVHSWLCRWGHRPPGASGCTTAPRGKGKYHQGKNRKDRKDRKDHGDKGSAKAKKQAFCLCRGTSAAQCTPTQCVGCDYQGKLGKKQRRSIQDQFPFSFTVTTASECSGTTTTTTTATPTTTTTPAVCGGS